MTLFTDLKNAGLPVISASDTQATFSRSLTDVESELYHDILDPTRAARRNDETMARVQLRAEYLSTITTLQQIVNAQSPSNAQVIIAVKFLAKTMMLIIHLLARVSGV